MYPKLVIASHPNNKISESGGDFTRHSKKLNLYRIISVLKRITSRSYNISNEIYKRGHFRSIQEIDYRTQLKASQLGVNETETFESLR